MPTSSRRGRWCNMTLLLCSVGCAAKLENPEAFADRAAIGGTASEPTTAGSAGVSGSTAGGAAANAGAGGALGGGGAAPGGAGSGGSSAGGAMPTADEVPACIAAIFATTSSGKCANGICHHAGTDAPGGLDLASPGVTARLVDQPASHLGASPNDGCPKGDKLIDSQNPSDSWLLKKLTLSGDVACGAKMPLTGNLTPEELRCLTAWVEGF